MGHDLVIPDSRLDTEGGQALAEAAAAFANLIPGVGGVVSAVLSGRLTDRKYARVAEMVDFLRIDLSEIRAEINEEYVASEDFEDLVEEVLKKAARERVETKRRLYARFLAQDATRAAAVPYDVKLRVLEKLEGLQEEHLQLLGGVANEIPPDPGSSVIASSRLQVLTRRTGLSDQRVRELVEDLFNDDLLTGKSVSGVVTAEGAEQTRHMLSRTGNELIYYLSLDE